MLRLSLRSPLLRRSAASRSSVRRYTSGLAATRSLRLPAPPPSDSGGGSGGGDSPAGQDAAPEDVAAAAVSASSSSTAGSFDAGAFGSGGGESELHADGSANIGDEPRSWTDGTGAPGSMRYGSGGMYGGGEKSPIMAAIKGEVNDTVSAREKAVDLVHRRKEIKEKLKANITGNYNPHDHFLLIDLDVEKDAVLFGVDRERFYDNVHKMKRVIIEYQRWERRDNFYIYGTRGLQLFVAAILFDTWEQYNTSLLLAANYDDYKTVHDDELAELRASRVAAFAAAEEIVRALPPDFRPVLAAARQREAVLSADPDSAAAGSAHPMDTTDEARRLREERDKLFGPAAAHHASPLSVPMLRALRRAVLPQSDDYTAVVKEAIAEHQRAKAVPSGEHELDDDVPAAAAGGESPIATVPSRKTGNCSH